MRNAGRSEQRIIFLIPACEFNGGTKQVLLAARTLRRHGFQVAVQCTALSAPQTLMGLRIEPMRGSFDLAVATWYETVAPAMNLAPRVVHFCQGYEAALSHFASRRAAIEEAYAAATLKLCISPHLAAFVAEKFASPVMTVAPLLDPLFKPRWRWRAPRPPGRVLLIGTFEAEVKGIAFGLEALARAAARFPLRVVRVSHLPATAAEAAFGLPADYHVNIPPEQVAALTRDCDLTLFTSLPTEGFGLPALESIAAGVPAIARRVPGQAALEHLGAVTVPAEDTPAAMANEIQRCLEPSRWRSARRSGLRVARSWRRFATDQLVRVFDRIIAGDYGQSRTA